MKIIDDINKQKLLLSISLILIGVISRISLHDFFNSINNPFAASGFLDVFFIIAVISILSGILLGKFYVFFIPICVILLTDFYYALIDPINYAIWPSGLFLFTYSGFVFIALLGLFTKKKSDLNFTFIPKILGAGIIGIIIYDLWTNFGFWLIYSKLGFYPQNIQGLISVIIAGIPFMLWHILSSSLLLCLVIIPLLLFVDKPLISHNLKLKTRDKILIFSGTVFLIFASIITTII